MAASSSVLRKSCSFPNILVTCLNFILLLLSISSVAPIIILRNPPTFFGFGFMAIALISFLSSFTGLFSRISHSLFPMHVMLLSSSLLGQLTAAVVLFTGEKQSLSSLKSRRDLRESKALVRLECGVFVMMIPIQIMVLVLTCALHRVWAREFEAFEAETAAAAMSQKRNRRIATQEEGFVSNVNAIKVEEEMMGKHVKWVKTDFEG